MTEQVGANPEHRPSVYGVRIDGGGEIVVTRDLSEIGRPLTAWGYRFACACGSHSAPYMAASWMVAMRLARMHMEICRFRQDSIEMHVAAFRRQLNAE